MRRTQLVLGVLLAFVFISSAFGILHIAKSGAAPALAPPEGSTASIVYDPQPTVPETKPASSGYRLYENVAYRFAVEYPEELGVEEYAEAYNAVSIVFRDPISGRGFQVYVTPYAEPEITEERFALDQPSGVREDARDFLVDGVRGIAFDGENASMGETAEVWIINGSYLYEIATYRRFDTWLDSILNSWQFI